MGVVRAGSAVLSVSHEDPEVLGGVGSAAAMVGRIGTRSLVQERLRVIARRACQCPGGRSQGGSGCTLPKPTESVRSLLRAYSISTGDDGRLAEVRCDGSFGVAQLSGAWVQVAGLLEALMFNA